MTQTEILNLLKEEEYLTGTEIILKLRKNGETKEWVRKSLKQMRHYNEVGFVLITYQNKEKVASKIPYIKEYLNNGYKIRRPSYFYYNLVVKK